MKLLLASILLSVTSAANLPYSSSTPSPNSNNYPGSVTVAPVIANLAYAAAPNNANNAPLMPYNFNWVVKDDPSTNNFNHVENSDGKVVRGEYRVQLPDGRTQIVKYSADSQTGYVAEVVYDGTATYPEQKPQPAAAVVYSNNPIQTSTVAQQPSVQLQQPVAQLPVNNYNPRGTTFHSTTAAPGHVQQQYNPATTASSPKRY